MNNEPAFYSNIDAVEHYAKQLITQGAHNRSAPMHIMALATIGDDGFPDIRNVINRGFDEKTMTIRFHSDKRSNKIQQIKAQPQVMLLFYHPEPRIQLRMKGQAEIHFEDEIKENEWDKTKLFSRTCYRIEPAPGTFISAPQRSHIAESFTGNEGVENFCPISVCIQDMEWLYLAATGHRRAKFQYDHTPEGRTILKQASWLVP